MTESQSNNHKGCPTGRLFAVMNAIDVGVQEQIAEQLIDTLVELCPALWDGIDGDEQGQMLSARLYDAYNRKGLAASGHTDNLIGWVEES